MPDYDTPSSVYDTDQKEETLPSLTPQEKIVLDPNYYSPNYTPKQEDTPTLVHNQVPLAKGEDQKEDKRKEQDEDKDNEKEHDKRTQRDFGEKHDNDYSDYTDLDLIIYYLLPQCNRQILCFIEIYKCMQIGLGSRNSTKSKDCSAYRMKSLFPN